MRFIGLDVHRDFCDVAIYDNGKVRSAGRVASSPEQLQLFAQSLCRGDHVALETTGNALSIARRTAPPNGRPSAHKQSASKTNTAPPSPTGDRKDHQLPEMSSPSPSYRRRWRGRA